MCGITGFFDRSRSKDRGGLERLVMRMCDQIRHRGPDDAGVWAEEKAGIALGHRRLSILDLSPAGHQPMHSASGRYVIVFNGEIYNFQELRQELEALGHTFRGHSDTEMMLAAFSQWDIEPALKRFTGMFAFALWDLQEKILHLARDRMGEKPLYYGWNGNAILFGSELKALRAYKTWNGQIDRDVLALYVKKAYIPAPFSIYRGIYKLIPGTLLSVPVLKATPGVLPEPKPYWSFREVADSGFSHPFAGSEEEACRELDRLLRSAVAQQMVADVPLGAFLSGGVDSSTIVAMMQAQSTRPVKTFTIGFQEADYNEAVHAKAVAKHLGTDHSELYVTPKEAMSVIPKLPAIYDEPFSDHSQIPTFVVSQLARSQVTVSLSGDAGDELFGGYNRYFGVGMFRKIQRLPLGARVALSKMLTLLPTQAWDALFAPIPSFAKPQMLRKVAGHRLHILANLLPVRDDMNLYQKMLTNWSELDLVNDHGPALRTFADGDAANADGSTELKMMWRDSIDYLPDDILVKVDRAGMAVSLESRIPMLNHHVVEFSSRIPLSMKIRNDTGKWILRKVLDQYVPRQLIERPKMGFGVPIGEWLRGPLHEWAENLLSESRLRSEGWFNPRPIRQKWDDHLAGRGNWQYHLWVILMFQAWHESANDLAPPANS